MGKGLVQFNGQAHSQGRITARFFPVPQSVQASCPCGCLPHVPDEMKIQLNPAGYRPRRKQDRGRPVLSHALWAQNCPHITPKKSRQRHSLFHRHPQQAVFAGNGGPLV